MKKILKYALSGLAYFALGALHLTGLELLSQTVMSSNGMMFALLASAWAIAVGVVGFGLVETIGQLRGKK